MICVCFSGTWWNSTHCVLLKGGFPSGVTGFVLVFLWSLSLGFLHWSERGGLLVLAVHIIADFTIGLLIMMATRRQSETVSTKQRQASSPGASNSVSFFVSQCCQLEGDVDVQRAPDVQLCLIVLRFFPANSPSLSRNEAIEFQREKVFLFGKNITIFFFTIYT